MIKITLKNIDIIIFFFGTYIETIIMKKIMMNICKLPEVSNILKNSSLP